MPFKDVSVKVDFPAQEREVLKFWSASHAFEDLRQLRKDDPPWSFIDGPITANNPMGVHHGWGRTYKDLFQRFWAMRERKLRYQNGFDCQGLWVEVEVEKEMGFKSKKDIEAFGLEQFVRKCKARVLHYAAMQTEQSVRLGYWMDWNDPEQLRKLSELIASNPAQEITIEGPKGEVTATGDENEDSVVMHVDFYETDLLYTGDIVFSTETTLLNAGALNPVEVLKVAHHGSATSTSTDFLAAVTPQESVICVGADNSYGHPSEETLDRLTASGAAIQGTDLDGNISFYFDVDGPVPEPILTFLPLMMVGSD